MKMNRLFASAAMLAALALTACSNEEAIVEQDNELREITLKATIGADTRTVVKYESNAYQTCWNKNDQIYVWGYTEATPTDYSSPDIQGTLKYQGADDGTNNSGTFSGYTTGAGTQLQYALYPDPIQRIKYISQDIKELFGAGETGGGGIQLNQAFQYSMKSTYIYDGNNITNTPMYVQSADGFTTNGNITFTQLCAMVRIPLVMTEFNNYQNLDDTGTTKVIVTLIADNVIAGSAVVGFTTDAEAPASMKMTETAQAFKKITYEIPENALANGQTVNGSTDNNEYVLDFPVPAGTHEFYVYMTFKKDNVTYGGNIYVRSSNDNVLNAGDILIPTPFNITANAGSFTPVS